MDDVAVNAKKYLSKYKIKNDRIAHRLTIIVKALHLFISQYKLKGKVTVNGRILEQLVIDYFVDSVRVKEFHNITKTNTEKVYAYSAYWFNRRKPLQVIKSFKGCEFINEFFVTTYLVSNIAVEKGIDNETKDKNPLFKQFQELLFYNLKYRLVTQQSLELMIDAFFCGLQF